MFVFLAIFLNKFLQTIYFSLIYSDFGQGKLLGNLYSFRNFWWGWWVEYSW